MFVKRHHHHRSATQFAMALVLSGFAAFAHSQPQIGLTSDTVSITGSGASAGFSQTGTIGADGTVSTISNVPSTNGVGIPSFAFTLVSTSTATNYNASFRVGIIIQDKNVPNRRFEAEIPTISLSVTGGVMTGTIPNTQSLVAKGRNGSGTLQVDVTATNTVASGPITISGGTVSMNAANLISRIRAANALFDTVILKEFDQPATYQYWIAVKETTANAAVFGKTTGGFAAFTGQPAAAPFALLTAGNYTGGYFVKGEFNVVFVSGDSGGGGGSTTTVTTGTTTLNNTTAALESALSGTGPISQETLNSVNTAVESGSTLAQNTAATISTLTTTQALDAFTSINNALALAGTAAGKGATPNTSSAVSTITNLATALSALNTSKTLDSTQKAQVTTIAANTLTSAANLVTSGASTTDILAIVSASSSILAQAAKATDSVVSTEVVTKVKELTNKAVAGVLNNLPESAKAGVALDNPEAVKTLMRDNPSVLQVALTASANLPNDASITVGGVTFTREQLIAQSLANQGTTNPLQGGLNFSAATAGFTVTTDSTTGNMTLTNGTETYVAASPASRLVPDSVPDGISYLPNGTAVLVGNGVATELAPTAFDSTGFSTTVTNAGFSLSYRENGGISIALGNNEKFSGAFAYDNLGTATSCGAISITSPTGDPASPSYAFVLNCANGPAQRITPIADNAKFYSSVSDAGLNISTDRNTGIVTIATVGSFKPSFFVTPLSINDTVYYDANKNTDGVAFRAKDANGDGKTDYEVISADGIQLMYGL